MELHFLDLHSASLWIIISTATILTISAIATFVFLKHAERSHRLAGFFTVAPIYLALGIIAFGDFFGIFSRLLPPLGLYPAVGFLASICCGMLCLGTISVICGRSVLKRSGVILSTVSTLICFGIGAYLTYAAWDFARYTYYSNLTRYDAGRMDIKDAFPALGNDGALLDSGIEILIIAILIVFLVLYFISLSLIDVRATARTNEDDDSLTRCCACCEHATCIESSRAKMLCRYRGTVLSSSVCRKYVYDPLKRRTFRPHFAHLDTSELDTDDII